ncbi:DNA excision repair protein ERCC-1 [Symbiodinium microadriaticum]|uniref:DNA excision repair protein ERCC-1 n=1 Tax=Symbiodinium microadriaticum TaxID=2951 RepID=A0A1Q9E6A6_SYMMI|nr:DNA excision repair protein ERCC-1 [Symbiodinium microadriaticum]CAE7865035.1 ERCC1 [Symbiodinium microadriaticum]
METREGASGTSRRQAQQAIVAKARQQQNPIVKYIQSTPIDFVEDPELKPDFLAGPETAVLFISLKFQRLHQDYLKGKVQSLGDFRNRVLLCKVDLEQPEETLEQVTLAAFHGKVSLLLAWSDAEAAAYLETLYRCQSKGAEALKRRVTQGDSRARFQEVLSTIKGINKSDAASLASRFGSFAQIARSTEKEFLHCHGIGDKKVKQLTAVLHKPFFPNEQSQDRGERGF